MVYTWIVLSRLGGKFLEAICRAAHVLRVDIAKVNALTVDS